MTKRTKHQDQPIVSYRVIGPAEFEVLARLRKTNMTAVCAAAGFGLRTYSRWKNKGVAPGVITEYRNILAALGVLDER